MKCLEDYCGQRRWRAWSVMPERIRLSEWRAISLLRTPRLRDLGGRNSPAATFAGTASDSNDLILGCAIRAGEGLREVWPCGAM